MDPEIQRALRHGHPIDITTTGRLTGAARRIEIVFHNLDGRIYISGIPNPHRQRAWLRNLEAEPRFTFHLKGPVTADLPATARVIGDPVERRSVLERIARIWHRDPELMVEHSPLIEVTIEGYAPGPGCLTDCRGEPGSRRIGERSILQAMGWQKFLGGATSGAADPTLGAMRGDAADTETVRQIVAQLEAMPRDQARFLAAFAYILTRAAAADLEISDAEERIIESLVGEHGSLPESHAVLVAQMARSQSLLYGGTEDYLVTRQFKSLSTDEQRLALLRCCYLVGAADDDISVAESDTLQEIAAELDVDRAAVNVIRHEFESKLSTIKAMLRLREAGPGAQTPGA